MIPHIELKKNAKSAVKQKYKRTEIHNFYKYDAGQTFLCKNGEFQFFMFLSVFSRSLQNLTLLLKAAWDLAIFFFQFLFLNAFQIFGVMPFCEKGLLCC